VSIRASDKAENQYAGAGTITLDGTSVQTIEIALAPLSLPEAPTRRSFGE
jgi:hypothetical protein